MITIDSLNVSYGDNHVIDSLSLSLPVKSVHGLIGMNGAGKTTLLNAMAGFIRPGSGSIMIQGIPLRLTDLAFLETENFFYSYITGREYLDLFKSPKGVQQIDEWNRLFKLPLDNLIESYSSGMKRKLALLGVLRQDKPLVILDEPFNGLDLESSRLLSMIVSRLKDRGKTVLITSHILGSLTGICDQIHLLRNGKIMLSRDKEQFSLLEQDIFGEIDPGYSELVKIIL